MISWSLKRRVTYISVLLGLIGFIAGWSLFVNTYEPPTCFDGKQNDLEAGPDCGGACQYYCPFQVSEPIVLFSRAFEVANGVYNAVAYVENPNFDIGNKTISYTFRFYDESNELVAERTGRTFVSVGQVSPIFEGTIETGGRPIKRTVFEFENSMLWEKMSAVDGSRLVIRNKEIENVGTRPRVRATLENTSVEDVRDVEVVAVVFNALENAVATSRTIVEKIPKKSSIPLVFTWPLPFETQLEACVVPVDVALLFDVSGSMNNDGDTPPQPLTDAKEAAAAFVERLTSNDRIGLITFATDARTLKVFSNQHAGTARQIRNIKIAPEDELGSTNMGAAFSRAEGMLLADSADRDDVQKIAILLTDGIANEPEDPGGEPFAAQHAKRAKEAGYKVYTIGLGESVNEAFLRSIATESTGLEASYYFKAAQSKDLIGVYETISDSICERGPAIVDVIPRLR